MKYFLAIDIGASSGRHIVGWRENGATKTKEVYRFPNGVQEQGGHLVWDVDALLSHVKAGIAAAKAEFSNIISLSIDTWGVDYVLLRGNEEVRPVYAYRHSRTEAAIPKVHEILPFAELYAKTGCQFQPFNSIYQLYADQLAGRLEGVTDFLMIPEYLLWKLCGVKSREYTNATTTGMVNAETGEFDPEIISALGLPPIFPKLQKPGTVLGDMYPQYWTPGIGGTYQSDLWYGIFRLCGGNGLHQQTVSAAKCAGIDAQASQGVQPLVRNEVTQSSPDTQASGLSASHTEPQRGVSERNRRRRLLAWR